MLRNVLLLVEPTPSGQVAKEVACRIAAKGDCNITALQIHDTDYRVDSERLEKSPRAMLAECVQRGGNGRAPGADPADAGQLGEDSFPDLNVNYSDKVLSGPKYALLCQEAESNDLTILGRDGNVGQHRKNDVKEIVNLMLEYRPRPVIIAPQESPPAGDDVLIAYDGTPGSSRAVQFFVYTGLAAGRNVHVMSVNRRKDVAAARTGVVADYLKKHGIDSVQHPVESREEPEGVIVEKIRETGASLLVSGAYGKSTWRRSIFGSVSDYLIRQCPVPLFCCQ